MVKALKDGFVKVFSAPKTNLLEKFLIKDIASKADEFKDEEARLNEIKRMLSTLGVDKRDQINAELIVDIDELLESSEIKEIISKKHDKKKNTIIYSVSGSFFEVFATEIETFELTPRSGLDALVLIKRIKDKGQKKESYDILEYKNGELLFLIAGGAGESIIENIGELAKNISISIPAHIQWTYKERKEMEKEASETLQEIYEETKRSKRKKKND